MAETGSELDRTLGQAVAVDVGARPWNPARLLQFLRSLNIWFWAIVGAPTLIAGVYYFGVAANLYASQAEFMVRAPKTMHAGLIGSLLQSTGLGSSGDDTAAVEDYIESRAIVHKLAEHDHLRAVLGRPEGDFVTRFPGIFGRTDFEALYAHYQNFVTVSTNRGSGVTTLLIKAYRPRDAHMLGQAILEYSEQLVNNLNEKARQDALAVARHEVARVQKRITRIQDELTAYRIKQKMVNPSSASASAMRLIQQMVEAETDARARLAELLKSAPNSPQIPLVRTRIASLDKLIGEERGKLSGKNNSVVTAISRYEHLTFERKLAERALASAFTSLETARVEAQRQQIYLEPIAQPNLPDYPLYPKRFVSFLIVVASCCLVYGLVWLLVAAVREHQSA